MDIALANESLNGQTLPADRVLQLVPQSELTAAWHTVKRGMEEVQERASDGWLTEDVYMALRQGTSMLAVGYVHQYYVGFAVLTPVMGWAGPQLHIWAAYNRGERDVLETFLPDLIELAKQRGCTRLTMASQRKGWARRAEQLGFVPGQTTYALEV